GNVMVTVPSAADLLTAGLIEEGDSAFVMVDIVSDLASMVDGNTSGGTQTDWANAVGAAQPVDVLSGAPYVAIHIIAGTSVTDVTNISDLGSLEANLFIAGTDFPQEDLDRVQLYAYESAVGTNDIDYVIVESASD